MPFIPSQDKIDELRFTIRGKAEGMRLDQYLVKRFPDYSRAFLQKLIKKGKVSINAKEVKASAKIRMGQEVSIALPQLEAVHLRPEAMPLDILYEDDHLAVLNKPAGLVIHPARGHLSGTLVNALLAHFDNLADANEDVYRPGIVHRLDRNTSGVLLIAKSNKAHSGLSEQFEHRLIHKEYLALVEGKMEFRAGTIILPLAVDTKHRERMAVHSSGKEAITDYQVIAIYPKYSLVHVFPKTGRTHQIRVHLKAQKHPIVADELYGAFPYLGLEHLVEQGGQPPKLPDGISPEIPLIERQALHAWRIHFEHPAFRKPMSFSAPLAHDYLRTLQIFQTFWPSPQVAELLGTSYEKNPDGI